MSPGDPSPITPQNFTITSAPIRAVPRQLKAEWTMEAANELRDLWGGPRYPDNALDLLRDALEDPNYDPNDDKNYAGLPRWSDGRIATEEEIRAHNPVAQMAHEMCEEIDKEILADLSRYRPLKGVKFSGL